MPAHPDDLALWHKISFTKKQTASEEKHPPRDELLLAWNLIPNLASKWMEKWNCLSSPWGLRKVCKQFFPNFIENEKKIKKNVGKYKIPLLGKTDSHHIFIRIEQKRSCIRKRGLNYMLLWGMANLPSSHLIIVHISLWRMLRISTRDAATWKNLQIQSTATTEFPQKKKSWKTFEIYRCWDLFGEISDDWFEVLCSGSSNYLNIQRRDT